MSIQSAEPLELMSYRINPRLQPTPAGTLQGQNRTAECPLRVESGHWLMYLGGSNCEDAMAETLQPVFDALRERMLRSGGRMDVAKDEAGNLVLKAPWNEPGKKDPAWFGAVQLKKSYVSCHLMPLYALPSMLERVSADLRKHMQGKSCFNFKKIEPELFDALEQLTADCAAAYAEPVVAKPH